VTQRLSPSQIRQYLDTVINKATNQEPLLAKRLRDFRKWIAQKKDGLLTSKRQVLDLLTELILDSELWLNLSSLSPDEKQQFYQENQFTPSEKYWFDELFPAWFSERDPQSPIWKQKIMAGEFSQSDETVITSLQNEIENQYGSSLWRYLLDLSMVTDLVVSGYSEKALSVQLTTLSGQWLDHKERDWQKILTYWQIKRGLLVSYSPKNLNYPHLVHEILRECDDLADNRYNKISF
jgi:hypothetical protein